MSYTHFTLLRHGQPEQANCLLGRTDPPLTDKGWQQMHSSANTLKFHLIISSPLLRCRGYAEQLADERNCQLILDDDWQELDFGLWDGQVITALWQQPNQHLSHGTEPTYSQFWHAPVEHIPPAGESSQALLHRITSSIDTLSRAYPGKQLLIVSHSGVMRMVLAWLLNSRQAGNAHLSQIQLDHAALLHFNTYIDETGTLWPQLQGFHNPCVYQHTLQDN
ncbi:histidine phosphatase family protein [Shewanella schlegeliana]|uniref:Histidine phosphatase family protein n=1 Tax=Shewanella schlegeliana TaxID=190308 RepID=A0ABS1T090_9GAMM|nr:histidine phosphatase family protein [Shewanella schlegeliana]MBL4914020.1 histidine phosphatase family protein [Shewanella schlegeliana]MCL1108597.1 histidine phosphatase family protein [Shewanella schlegeliana]GIU35689.1 alpha-ribazole-5'-phosphate phosphatase [Shewanella schlegeliana]